MNHCLDRPAETATPLATAPAPATLAPTATAETPAPSATSNDATSTVATTPATATATPLEPATRYIAPDGFNRHVFNPLVSWLTRRGVSVWGSRVLEVRGRRSGELRTTPVNVLSVDGARYLVAPRGVTEWVRNVRAAGACTLRVGRRREQVAVTELADAAKPDVLRAYLRRWKFEVGQFFDGVDAGAADDRLLAIASGYPVFVLTQPSATSEQDHTFPPTSGVLRS